MEDQHEVRLFGAFSLKMQGEREVIVRSEKAKALLALLLTSANGKHARTWLQSLLWGRSGEFHGRSSLRRLLSDMRKQFGEEFSDLFTTTNSEVQVNVERFRIVGSPLDGQFLEGLDIEEPEFKTWVSEKRSQNDDRRLKLPSEYAVHINPSVAVIPFTSFSEGSFETKIGDLLALEVTRVLSRSKLIDVTSHLSSRQFQYATLDVADVRRVLNVEYLLYGSIRARGDEFTLFGDFIDLRSEKVLWSQEYSSSAVDFMAQHGHVAHEIALDTSRSIAQASLDQLRAFPSYQIQSHALLMSAVTMMHRHQRADFFKARELLEELIERCPSLSSLHAWLAKWYVLKVHQGLSDDRTMDAKHANQCSDIAVRIDPLCSFSLTIDGLVKSNLLHDFGKATEQWELALQVEPNNAMAWLLKGTMHAFTDEGLHAVMCTTKSRNLSPLDPHKYYFDCLTATAHLAIDDFETARKLADDSYQQNTRHASTLRVRTIALQAMGQKEQARLSALELLKREPNLTVQSYLDFHPAANFATGQTWAKHLQDAGIPKK